MTRRNTILNFSGQGRDGPRYYDTDLAGRGNVQWQIIMPLAIAALAVAVGLWLVFAGGAR